MNAIATRVLWFIVGLSLVPAGFLAYRRVQAEGSSLTATLVIDQESLIEQADFLGLRPLELGERYRAAGLNGVALYEDTFEMAADKGRIAMLSGNEARAVALSLGEPLPDIPVRSTLITEIEAGALGPAIAKNGPAAREVVLAGRSWYLYPGDGAERPFGPDPQVVRAWQEAGFDIAYRPKNTPYLRRVGEDFPAAARYLIHQGTEVAGAPNALDQTVQTSQPYLTGVVEMVEQDGMSALVGKVPMVRVFSLNQDWLNTLDPQEAAEKYVLAANERNARVLYIRPYTTGTRGDLVTSTETLIRGVRQGLESSGFVVAPLDLVEVEYSPNGLLRGLSAVGVVAGLGLLGLMYPGAWGVLVAGALLALGVLAGRGLNWDALALVAALAFPVVGYGHLPGRLQSFFSATLVSLAGALLLVAVGTDQAGMMGVSPFAGVAATLVVPPALFLFHTMLRYRPPAVWVRELWHTPIRLGYALLGLVGVAALAVVFLRRGNFPVIGVSDAEVGFRRVLNELFARPRFKELIGHPLAVLGLGAVWPAWLRGALLTGGVIGQASILNSFSHYHTPLVVSLERTLIALGLGLVVGLVALPITRLLSSGVRRWLRDSNIDPNVDPNVAQRA